MIRWFLNLILLATKALEVSDICPTCGAKNSGVDMEPIGFDISRKRYECGYSIEITGQFGENEKVLTQCGEKK